MIFGSCPYCDHPMTLSIPDGVKLPIMEKRECDNCHKEFFEKLSRIDPEAFTLEEVEVDEVNKSVKVRGEAA